MHVYRREYIYSLAEKVTRMRERYGIDQDSFDNKVPEGMVHMIFLSISPFSYPESKVFMHVLNVIPLIKTILSVCICTFSKENTVWTNRTPLYFSERKVIN